MSLKHELWEGRGGEEYALCSSTGGKILAGHLVLVILTIVVASPASGWLAHVLQKRSGMSPWLVAPLTIVAVTVAAVVALFLIGVLIVSVVDATRKRPAPPRQPPAVNRRVGGNERIIGATLVVRGPALAAELPELFGGGRATTPP